MSILKSFCIVCKNSELKKALKKELEPRIATSCFSPAEFSYDFYHEFEKEKEIGRCDECHDSIRENDEAYRFNDDLIHADCIFDYLEKFKL